MKNGLIALIFFGLCVSCQSSPLVTYDDIPIGATKGWVLNELGNPKRTYRQADADHWVYVFPRGPEKAAIEREILFQDGVVVRKVILGEPKDSDFVPIN